jgi:hypothetical protein
LASKYTGWVNEPTSALKFNLSALAAESEVVAVILTLIAAGCVPSAKVNCNLPSVVEVIPVIALAPATLTDWFAVLPSYEISEDVELPL